MAIRFEDRSTPSADAAVRQIAQFFGWLTPGDEKALRAGWFLEENPALEDVSASTDDAATLLARVRDRLTARVRSEEV